MSAFWEFVKEVIRLHGSTAAILIVLVFLFWKLIWKVWDRAMTSKDNEINRLVAERDKYQALVFERLLSSNPPVTNQVVSQKKEAK